MKTLKTILFFLLITSYANAQKFNSALDYLNYVGKEQKNITKSMWNYTKAIAHSKSDKSIRNKRKVLLKTIDKAIIKIKRAKGYDGDEFKNQVLTHLELNKNILNQDYGKIIDMKEVAEQSYDLMEAYFLARKLAEKRMKESQEDFEIKYYSFATKHKIRIVENESDLSKKMKISNEVFDHYDEMYLLFFKVKINENYLYDAIRRNDANAIQQNSDALGELAQKGLEKLNTITLYKEDKSIVNTTEKIFKNYLDIYKNDIPKVIDFLILNEDFNKIKKAIDNTPQRKRTKEQIDVYNAKVKTLNNSVKEFNTVNSEMTLKSNNLLNELNNVNSQFLSKHIPND